MQRIARKRDAGAFERLYHHYRDRLGPFIFRVVRDPGANEEVFNDVMLAVWRKGSQYNGTARVSTWIFAIAYRQCLKKLRDRRPFEELGEHHLSGPDEERGREQRDLVRRALEQLSPEHRMVIELSYFQGNKYEEIAAIAGCPANTIKTRMFHARRRLKEIMENLGETSPAE